MADKRKQLQCHTGKLNNKWLLETKTNSFYLATILPTLVTASLHVLLPVLCRSDEYQPTKSEMQRNLPGSPSFLTAFTVYILLPLLSSLYLNSSFTVFFSFFAYMDIILFQHDDLRFGFGCCAANKPNKPLWQQQMLPVYLLHILSKDCLCCAWSFTHRN